MRGGKDLFRLYRVVDGKFLEGGLRVYFKLISGWGRGFVRYMGGGWLFRN